MRSAFYFFMLSLCYVTANAQAVIDVSKTQTITKDGMDITTFQGKPLTGYVTENYSNGKPKSWKTVKEGIPEGLWQEWYENGQLKFNAFWLNGKGHGRWEYYHENGALRQEEFYNLDIPTGIFREYYNNGKEKSKTSWLNGKKHGAWTSYSESGIIIKTEEYQNGNLITVK